MPSCINSFDEWNSCTALKDNLHSLFEFCKECSPHAYEAEVNIEEVNA